MVNSNLDKEYAGITGVPSFTKAAAVLAYSSGSSVIKDDRLAITQSISGTGALRIGAEFLARFHPSKKIFIPTPSWANHNAVFKDSGLDVEKYRYYNKDTIGLDFEGMVADLKSAPEGSIVLLHACAHNPTGIDPTEEQWKQISDVVKSKNHYPFFDMAYQGFASGDTDRDAFPVRHFVAQGHQLCLAQSFAKNMVHMLSSWILGISHPLTHAGTIWRTCGGFLDRLRLGRREEARGFADQNPCPTTVFESSCAWRSDCCRDPERSKSQQAMAGRSQGYG